MDKKPETDFRLKADRPHVRDNYRHTDKFLRLVTVILGSQPKDNYLLMPSASRAPNIDRCVPDICPWPLKSTSDLGLWPWPRPWPQSKVIGNEQRSPNTIFSVWPWPLTYDLDLQAQPSLGQGWPQCKVPRSKVKQFRQDRPETQTRIHTDWWAALPIALSRCFAKATQSIKIVKTVICVELKDKKVKCSQRHTSQIGP